MVMEPCGEQHRASHVLIVDDSALMRRIIAISIEPLGVSVHCVTTPQEALEFAESEKFDLLITDINMPGMTGFEMVQKIHEQQLNANVPVVVVSAALPSSGPGPNAALAPSIDAWVLKPINPLHVRMAAARMLKLEAKPPDTICISSQGTNA